MNIGRSLLIPSIAALVLALSASALADGIKRIVHPDGTVEFTNVKSASQPRASSGNDTVYRYTDDNGVVAYSSIQPAAAEFDVIRFHCYACDPESSVDWRKTPLFTTNELRGVGVGMALYPLSAFRAMSAAALNVYETLRREGTQAPVVDKMQTRMELYDVLGYQAYEDKLDELFREKGLTTGKD